MMGRYIIQVDTTDIKEMTRVLNCTPKIGQESQRKGCKIYGERIIHRGITISSCSICAGEAYTQRGLREILCILYADWKIGKPV